MKKLSAAEFVRALPKPAADLIATIVAEADKRRLPVYLVGGPVRDLLLGRDIADIDLIVEAGDDKVALDLAKAVTTPGARVISHDRFGTVSVSTPEASLDLARVRRETYAHDGALPTVAPGSLEDDLRRRDFSVNTLALPLSQAARSVGAGVIDLDEGRADLERGQLRVLHSRSFHDDPTRALRAARLAPRLGFVLSRGSRTALRDALRDGAFSRISGDRLRREFVKLFEDPRRGLDPAKALRLLGEWHVLGALEPGLDVARDCIPPLRRLGRSIANPPWSPGRWNPWVSGLALWLAPLPAGLRNRTLRRLAVRGAAMRRVSEFPRSRDAWLRALARARGRGAVDSILVGVHEEDLQALLVSAPVPMRRRLIRFAREDRARRLPVSGDDLVALGVSGPAVGRALTRIRVAYLDGNVKTRDEALALARELVGRRSAARSRSRPRSRKSGRTRKARAKSKASRGETDPEIG